MKNLSKIVILLIVVSLLAACGGKTKTKTVYKKVDPQTIISKIEGCDRVDYVKERDVYVCQPKNGGTHSTTVVPMPEIDIDVKHPKASHSTGIVSSKSKPKINTVKPKTNTVTTTKPKLDTTKPKLNTTKPRTTTSSSYKKSSTRSTSLKGFSSSRSHRR